MKRRKFNIILFCLFIIISGSFNVETARAASADIEITSDSDQISVGDTVLVYINIKSDSIFDNVEANLTYDDNILEYKEGLLTGGSGF